MALSVLSFLFLAVPDIYGLNRYGIDVGELATMEANTMTYDHRAGRLEMQGSVRIVYADMSLDAEKVVYNIKTKDVVAEKDVVLQEGEDVLRCDRLAVNLGTKRGVVYGGKLFLKRKNFHITCSKAEKLGEVQYRVYNATLTSCDAAVPAWKFSAKQLDVKMEGYATAKSAAFHVKNVPMLYFPWGVFPVKTERQTGFLFPEFGWSSQWGPEITIPFYWAIGPNHDATFYLQRIGDSMGRGFKEGVEYRYALSSEAKGWIRGFYLWDEREKDHRWSILHRHDQSVRDGYYLKADINLVSDDEYPVDFDEEFPAESLIDARSLNQLESRVALGKGWHWGSLDTEFSYFRDLDAASNATTLQRLPEVTFELFQNQLSQIPLFYELESQGTHFWRREGTRGGRIDIYPKISVIERFIGVLRAEASFGYRETLYFPEDDPEHEIDEFTSRELYDMGASLATTIGKVHSLGESGLAKLWHTIEPELEYTYIPRVDQTNNPFFDDLDSIAPANRVTWALTNRVMGKRMGGPQEARDHEYLYWKLYQSYDFSHDFTNGERLSNFVMESNFTPIQWASGTLDMEYNPHQQRLDLLNTGIKLRDNRGDRLAAEYRFTKDEIEELNVDLRIHVIDALDLSFGYRHNLLDDVRIQTVYGVYYRHQCWGLDLRVADINRSPNERRDDELKVTVNVTLSGIGESRLRVF